MKITYELLEEKGACQAGLRWFKRNFPDGCELNDETISKIKDCDTGFVWWFYNNIQQDKRLYQLCGVSGSNGVSWSDGVNRSDGVSGSFGIVNSFGVNNALFLADKPRRYSIFGRPVSRERFVGIRTGLYGLLGDWRPSFNNIKALWLANGSDWKLTPVADAEELSIKEAWSGMPEEAVEYLVSLPEFDAEIFKRVTGIKVTEGYDEHIT